MRIGCGDFVFSEAESPSRSRRRAAEMSRAILIVLDSAGCGGGGDAKAYGDEGADTLGHIAQACAAGKGDREGLRRGPCGCRVSRRSGSAMR